MPLVLCAFTFLPFLKKYCELSSIDNKKISEKNYLSTRKISHHILIKYFDKKNSLG